jgi:hypothetical protein
MIFSEIVKRAETLADGNARAVPLKRVAPHPSKFVVEASRALNTQRALRQVRNKKG